MSFHCLKLLKYFVVVTYSSLRGRATSASLKTMINEPLSPVYKEPTHRVSREKSCFWYVQYGCHFSSAVWTVYRSQRCEFPVATVNRADLSRASLGRSVLPAESQPARAVRSAATRGDTLDKLNSDKSACQYDLNRGRYFLSTSCHISAPSGLILPATWLGYGRRMIKEWKVSVAGLTCGRKGTGFD